MKKLFSGIIALGVTAAAVAYGLKKYNDYCVERDNNNDDDITDNQETDSEEEQQGIQYIQINRGQDDASTSLANGDAVSEAVQELVKKASTYQSERILMQHHIVYFDQELQSQFIEDFTKLGYQVEVNQGVMIVSKTIDNKPSVITVEANTLFSRIFSDFAVYKKVYIEAIA